MSWETRRQHFIDAAIQVVANEGVARATIRRIAEVAEVPMAGLHYCFETKEDLFQAVVEASVTVGSEFAKREVKPGMGLARAVEVILKGYFGWIVENRSMQQAQFELLHWALRVPGSEHLAALGYRSFLGTTAQLLREARQEHEMGIDVEMLAQHIIALADGHALQWLALDNDTLGAAIGDAIFVLQAAIAARTAKLATV
jgi:AcrR family transcriptional regulator